MSDDTVTRLRDRSWCWCKDHDISSCDVCSERADAADEIERLRIELQRSLLQTNVMRNIALVPLGERGEKIEMLLADRDRWHNVAWLGHKVIFSKWEYTQFEQAYEEALEELQKEKND